MPISVEYRYRYHGKINVNSRTLFLDSDFFIFFLNLPSSNNSGVVEIDFRGNLQRKPRWKKSDFRVPFGVLQSIRWVLSHALKEHFAWIFSHLKIWEKSLLSAGIYQNDTRDYDVPWEKFPENLVFDRFWRYFWNLKNIDSKHMF